MSTTNDTDTDTSRVQKVYDTSNGRYGRRKPDECAHPSGYLPRTFRFRYSVADKLTEPTTWLIIGGVCLLLLLLVGAFIYANNRRTEGRRPIYQATPVPSCRVKRIMRPLGAHAVAAGAFKTPSDVTAALSKMGLGQLSVIVAVRHRQISLCLQTASFPRPPLPATRGAALHTPSHRRSTRRQTTCTSTAPRASLRTFRRRSRACTVRGWVRSPKAPLPVYSSHALSCPSAENRRRPCTAHGGSWPSGWSHGLDGVGMAWHRAAQTGR
jgi:hypothetical protein